MANGKSLASSLLLLFFVLDLPALDFPAEIGTTTPRTVVSVRACSDTGWDKSVTSRVPSRVHSPSARSSGPWSCEHRPWSRLPLRGREPSLHPEYPTRGVDCPHISCGAPAWGSGF